MDADTTAAPPTESEAVPAPKAKKNPVRGATLTVLALCALIFTYSVFADRFTPNTDQATVQAYIVNIAPDVAGRVRVVNVVDNQGVATGQVLFELDPERYSIEVSKAEADLAAAGLTVGASTAALSSAQAKLTEAKAQLANAEAQASRTFGLVKQGIESKARGDLAKREFETSAAAVERATADVEQARQNLGPTGVDNPQIRIATAALDKAKRDLLDTVVRAPADGVVTNLQLSEGQFVGAGQAVMTFLDREIIWIEAQFRENSLEYLKPGDPADVVLDVYPGRTVRAKVESISWGVDTREINPSTGLPKVKNDKGWIRETQRFIIRIAFDPERRPKGVRIGSQANVVVYTGKSWITDSIGWFWIRLISYLSYLN
jgi:multidrug resistance efflux pump